MLKDLRFEDRISYATDIRKAIHSKNCKADPNSCPDVCSCHAKLSVLTAIAWDLSTALRCKCSECTRRAEFILELLCGRTAINYHRKTNKRLFSVIETIHESIYRY